MTVRPCASQVILPLILVLVCSSAGTAATIRVEAGGSIKEAVETAANGDTVLVAAGYFSGPGNRDMEIIDKSLTVIAEDGPEVTTIDLSSEGRAFRIEGGGTRSVTIRGFGISGGRSTLGGAVFVKAATLELEQCYIHHCVAPKAYSGHFYWSGCGGGLCVWPGGDAHVIACTFAVNTAQAGNGYTPGFGTSVYADGGASALVERCLFMDDWGGSITGVLHADGEIYVDRCIFFGGPDIGWNWSGWDFLEADPYVCGSGNAFPYAPCNDSRCLPDYNPWTSYIGALQVNCGSCNSPVESLSWGRIKSLYRGSAD